MAVKTFRSKYEGAQIENLLDNMHDIVEVKDDIVIAKDVMEAVKDLGPTFIDRVVSLENRVLKIEVEGDYDVRIKSLETQAGEIVKSIESLRKDTIIPVANKVNLIASQHENLKERVAIVEEKIESFATTEEINAIVI